MKSERIVTLSVTLTLLVSTAIGRISYPIVDTDQSLFYNNTSQIAEPKSNDQFYGQDAHHRGNQPSYTDNHDGTITDNVTGLMWQRDFAVMGYDEAVKMAQDTTIAGYSDWRVPSIKEAYSLIMFSGVDASSGNMTDVPANAVPFINVNFFGFKYGANGTRIIDTQILSTSKYVGSTPENPVQQLVFGVNMADGRIKGYPVVSRGEAKLYTVHLVRGDEYGINKFKDNKNGTISDRATGLMWQAEDSGEGMDWQSALEYAQQMNEKKHLGYSDWRVPNVKELQSIVDYSRSPESTSSAAIDPMFTTTQITNEGGQPDYPYFWSSTTHCSVAPRNGGSAAAYVSFGRALGNMPQVTSRSGARQQGQGQAMAQRSAQQGQVSANRQQGQGRMAQSGQSGQSSQSGQSTAAANWVNIHGAGAQRSDPKSGDPALFANGRGPQGDALRINNFVRLVRDI